jgi:peptidoglycan-associated lipoprotein
MKQLLVACLVMLVSACASTTGKNTADLGSGAGKQSSAITSETKSPAATAQDGTAGGAATTKGANSAKDAAGQSGNSPAGTSSGAAAGAGTDAGPGQSATGSQTGSSAADASVGQPEVSSQAHSDAQVQPLDGQSASGTDGAAASSAQGGSPTADATSAGSAGGKDAADNSAVASSASAAKADKAGAAGTDKAGAPGTDKAGTQTGGANDGSQSMPHEVVDPSVSGTVTEQQLKAANPMLAERSVFYDFDKYEIKDQYAHIIEAHANFLVEHPTVKVFIEGHCDDRGSPEYNMVLGQRRAESVLKAMQALGVAAKQMEAVSFGAERPMAHGHDEDSWVKNRRSDIVYPLRK